MDDAVSDSGSDEDEIGSRKPLRGECALLNCIAQGLLTGRRSMNAPTSSQKLLACVGGAITRHWEDAVLVQSSGGRVHYENRPIKKSPEHP